MAKITLFSQIINKIDKHSFKSIVNKHDADKHNKGINTWTHFVSMVFLHMSKSSSLREVSDGLRSATTNVNHMGISKIPSKSSISYNNAHRDWHFFHDAYFAIYSQLSSSMGGNARKFKIKTKKIFLLDSTVISLCMTVFDWAKYKTTKGAIKLHTLLDYDTCLPEFIHFSEGRVHDARAAHMIHLPKDSLVVADRGYVDFKLFNNWDSSGNNFVVRLKSTVKFNTIKEQGVLGLEDTGILSDEVVELSEESTKMKYHGKLRRVKVYDAENSQEIQLITNNLKWSAATIGNLYKARWQIESFFKEVKQQMKIKTFVGTSENAVLIQIWTAMITIMMLKYLKAIAKYPWCLSNLIAFLRLNMFVKIDLQLWLDMPFEPPDAENKPPEQYRLNF